MRRLATAPAISLPAAQGGRARGGLKRRLWFGALLAAICLEGLGRKFVPVLPGPAWYFLKDAVLLAGFFGRAESPAALGRPFTKER